MVAQGSASCARAHAGGARPAVARIALAGAPGYIGRKRCDGGTSGVDGRASERLSARSRLSRHERHPRLRGRLQVGAAVKSRGDEPGDSAGGPGPARKWRSFATPDRRILLLSIALQLALALLFGHSYDARVFMSTGYLVGTGHNPYVGQDLSAAFHHIGFRSLTTGG